MPTKPDPVNDLPPPWADAGNYANGVYGPTLPWGDANPLAGTPLPWGGQPRLNATALTSFASTGLTPQVPTEASNFNEWLRRVQVWADWVSLGTNAADADAHIVESNGAGLVSAVAFEATIGYQGAGASPAILLMGFSVPASETSTFGNSTTVTWGTGATLTWGTGANLTLGAGSTIDMTDTTSWLAPGEMRFYSSGTTLPNAPGRTRWNDTFWSFQDGTSTVRTFDEPARGFDLEFTTSATAADTTATAVRRVKHNEPVWIEMGCRFEGDTASDTFNYVIRVSGPLGTVNVMVDDAAITVANVGYHMHTFFEWTPTDTWPAETDPQNYTFISRLGISTGNLIADRVGIKVSSNVEV